MARVVVRFAGEPDPQVRRKALRDGGALKPGQVKRFVYRGYLVSIVGGRSTTMATAVELGVDCIALWSTVLTVERQNSFAQIRRLPTKSLLRAGELPDTGADEFGNPGPPAFPAPPRPVVRTAYEHKATGATRNGGIPSEATIRRYFSAKLDIVGPAVTHAVCQPLFYFSPFSSGADQEDPVSPWLQGGAVMSSRLSALAWMASGSRGVEFTDDWLSEVLGGSYVFCGLADREPQDGWNSSALAAREWLVVGPTPAPRLIADPQDGGSESGDVIRTNNLPHTVTRGCRNAWRQSCAPGVYAGAGTLVVAAPCLRIDDEMFLLQVTAAEGSGYISTRSFEWNYPGISMPLIPQAGEATLALVWFAEAPTTEFEVENFAPPGNYLGPAEQRYVGEWSRGIRSFVGFEDGDGAPIGQPTVGQPAPSWVGAYPLSILDLPAWCHPGLCSTMSQYMRETETSYWDFIPEVTSGHRMPGVFGAVYTTEVDGVVEFAFSVRAADPASVPVGVDRREEVDDDLPTTAAIVVNKTCLAFVTVDPSTPSAPATRIDFRDVIGPADCPQYDASMDQTTAFLPAVKFATVLGGQRVYAVRAVRYRRTPFLASGRSRVQWGGFSIGSTPIVPSYKGRSELIGPLFFTDRAFGPYPDTTNYEELWILVDGVKHRVDLAPLGGLLEPLTEAKYNYTTYFPYNELGSAWYVLHYQILGMLSEEEEADYELLDHFADEEAPAGMEDCSFAKVSETDLMFLVYRRSVGAFPGQVRVCRFSTTTGEASLVASVKQVGRTAALTCYQREVTIGNEVVVPAHLFLRMGYDKEGVVLRSTDAGATWEKLYDDGATTSTTQPDSDGVPSLGLHALSVVGQVSDPHNILRPQPEED